MVRQRSAPWAHSSICDAVSETSITVSHRLATLGIVVPTVQVVEPGRAATEALASAIVTAKGSDALAPVTVIVPSNLAGLFARRLLGSGDIAGVPYGVANVQFVTAFRLAELLSADVLVERRPLTNPVLASAVRRALADDQHPFGDAAAHRATEAAVANLYAEVSHLSDAGRRALGGDSWGATAIGLQHRVGAYLSAFSGEDDVARTAAGRPDLRQAVASLGHVIWFLPDALTATVVGLVAAVLAATPSTAIVALTGNIDADRGVLATCRRGGLSAVPASPDATDLPTASRIVTVTDADEEVRAVVSAVWGLAVEGVRLDRVGVVYPATTPYLRTLLHQFQAAELPVNGPSPARLGDSVAGRVLTDALALDDEAWRRNRVMAIVAAGPLRSGGHWVHPTAWERLTRDAGVVGGHDDWHRKLSGHEQHLRDRAAELTVEAPNVAERSIREADQTASLLAFVVSLRALVQGVDRAKSWHDRAHAARVLLDELLGLDRHHQRWPDEERQARDRVVDALARLSGLDDIEPGPSTMVFRRALDAELEAPGSRHERFGEGVSLIPMAAATGLDLDAVFVLGLAEGLCPFARREEALLPEATRQRTDGELPTPTDALHIQHRRLLHALAAAPTHRRMLTFARGDLRGGRRHLPSRWLLDTASALAGHQIHSGDLDGFEHPAVEHRASFAAGLRTVRPEPSLAERDLGAAAIADDAGYDIVQLPAVTGVARAIVSQQARRSPSFTEWDGNLAGQVVPSPAAGAIVSPTSLESWASCGFRYFLSKVLHLSERDDPEQLIELSPLERGSVAHEVLERFIRSAIDDGVPDPEQPWTKDQRRRLHEIADAVFSQAEASGRTGRSVYWRQQQLDLHRILERFADIDDKLREALRTRPADVEMAFGFDGAEPVSVSLGDGRTVRFRGRIDRVDAADDGTNFVYDYKTGRGKKYGPLSSDGGDPVLDGTALQLGVYAEAARQRRSVAHAEGRFWLVEAEPSKAVAGRSWDDDDRQRFVDVVRTIVDGVESGAFAAIPGDWDTFRQTNTNCAHCEFDGLCPVERGEHADAKSAETASSRHGLEWRPDSGDGDGEGDVDADADGRNGGAGRS